MGLIQSDQKVTQEKIVQIERFMDRVRASNSYGEPILNFNEDSVTKAELKEAIEGQAQKITKRIKDLQNKSSQSVPVIDDMMEDMKMLKDKLKKQQTKIEKMETDDFVGTRPSNKTSPRIGETM